LIDAVNRLLKDQKSDRTTRRSCEGILFTLEQTSTDPSSIPAPPLINTSERHIMISYQWDVQPFILQVLCMVEVSFV